MINIKCFSFNPFQENCYLVWDSSMTGIIIDPGCYDQVEIETLTQFIKAQKISLKAILLTHGHFDHIFGVKELTQKFGIEVYMSIEDEIILKNNDKFTAIYNLKEAESDFKFHNISEGDVLKFGTMSFIVITTPGHTPGGVCYYNAAEKIIFTGDTLFAGSIGRTDNSWGDYDKLIVGIMEKLMYLDSDVEIYPGHGCASNIGYERTHNPFLEPFNEPDDLDLEEN